MKLLPIIAALLAAVALTSCSDRSGPRPILSGKAVSGTIWQYSPGNAQTSTSFTIPPGSDVEVYEKIIVVRMPGGPTRVGLLSHLGDLTLK